VVYPLLNLTGGKHQLIIKAWDLVSNSSKDTIDFEIPMSANAPIQNLMNAPNPVVNFTRFSFDIKETSSTASCVFEIYDLQGQKKYTKLVDPSLFNSKVMIDWDGMDYEGRALLPGIYIYKVSLLKGASRIELTNKLIKL
jgi:flagellar hook assembly protein FlgD